MFQEQSHDSTLCSAFDQIMVTDGLQVHPCAGLKLLRTFCFKTLHWKWGSYTFSHCTSNSPITPGCTELKDTASLSRENKNMSVWNILSTWIHTNGLCYGRDLRNSFHFWHLLPFEYTERFQLAATVLLASRKLPAFSPFKPTGGRYLRLEWFWASLHATFSFFVLVDLKLGENSL